MERVMRTLPLYLAGEPHTSGQELLVLDKYSQATFARVAKAGPRELEQAIGAAHAARAACARLPAWKRRDALLHLMRRCEEEREQLARTLCAEAGKPLVDSRGEVARLVETLRLAAEEATRIAGEWIPMDNSPRTQGRMAMTRRVPVGACAFITPFNFPLNLAAHKLAPALAAGCPFVLKPASATPLSALMLGSYLAECDLPPGSFSILPMDAADAAPLVEDPRLSLLSFTGSPTVGWDMKRRAGKKKVVLELGGNAAVISEPDTQLEDCVERLLFGAFYQSGQSCIKTQRILVHASLYEELRARLLAGLSTWPSGNPHEEHVRLGPLIDEREAVRLERWIQEAQNHGARVLCGGRRRGAVLEATLLEQVPPGCAILDEEAFGPVAVLSAYTDFETALQEVNRSRFGLQAGVFTRDIHKAQRAWSELEVGAVLIGDVPSFRADHLPYGGVKDSGLGREGVRSAIEEMTEPRLLVIRTPPA
jgi:acyl-CoA reductase-like NAD-dependent aldehyde dehydrogenase